MTVKELIAELSRMNPDAVVELEYDDGMGTDHPAYVEQRPYGVVISTGQWEAFADE